ncbi:dual OB domain-containing protein [Saccharothrix luteola]|uniref:dual OB domain-containing protein n=1 Tax=Saccharothrix luteola TaxID=2893018 RepID=UPI00355682F2
MVCLVNSRKHQGRCVAGIAIGRGGPQWTCPVSGRPGHEVSPLERQYRGGAEPGPRRHLRAAAESRGTSYAVSRSAPTT